MSRRLPSDVYELLTRTGNLLTLDTARKAGIDDSRLRRLCRDGRLIRIAPGTYTDATTYDQAEPWTRHRLRVRAVGKASTGDTYATGWSAVAMYDLRTLGSPPDVPQMVRPARRGLRSHRSRHAQVAVARVPRDHLLWFSEYEMGIVSPGFAVVDLARHAPIPAGLVVADDVARRGVQAASGPAADGRFDLDDAVSHVSTWPGLSRSRFVVAHADPASESAQETLGRFTCLQFDLPMPVSNASIRTENGRWFRPDQLWPWHWVVGEADGAIKYNNKPNAARVVADEKEREWLLRHHGLDVLRYGWDLAYGDRATLAYRIQHLLDANPPRREPVRWWKTLPDGRRVEATLADQPSPGPTGVVLPGRWDRTWP